MLDRTANLLGAVGLAVADRIEEAAIQVMNRAGETPAALVVIGYNTGPSNDQLRRILGLSHPGAVRLVDRLVDDRLVERHRASDRRAVALFLTRKGHEAREKLLSGRLAAIKPLLSPLSASEESDLGRLLARVLESMPRNDLERCHLCRMCDDVACEDCPIPAEFKQARASD